MKRWLRDNSFRSLLRNTGYQGLSRAAAALCSLGALAFAGRGLGPQGFGLLVLIQSYVGSASGLAKFQSWQLVIRFGAPALSKGDPEPFKRACGFALGLDLLSGLGGMFAAMALLPWLAPWLHIPRSDIFYAFGYCLLLPTMAAATPVGVLRALDRFDLIGVQGTLTPIIRAILALVAWMLAWPLSGYVAIWFITALTGDLYGWYAAWRELRRRGLHGFKPVLRPQGLEDAWKFAINVNLASSLNVAAGPITNLLVGGILGPAAAGVYRIARSVALTIERPGTLMDRAFYPEVARLDFSTNRPWKLMIRSSLFATLISGTLCVAILAGGNYLIPKIFGHQYQGAFPVVAIMVIGTLIAAMAFPVVPMLYALHRASVPLIGKLWGTTALLLSLYPLCMWGGVPGAAIALVVAEVVATAVMLRALRLEYIDRILKPAARSS